MIGVTNGTAMLGGGPNHLKRDILFFDRISVIGASNAIKSWREGPYYYKEKYQSWANDLEYLISTKFFTSDDTYKKFDPKEIDENNAQYHAMCEQMEGLWNEMISLGTPSGNGRSLSPEESERFSEMNATFMALQARMSAEAFQVFDGEEAVTIDGLPGPTKVRSEYVKTGDVLRLCMMQVPLLSENTSWQDVQEMKSDNDLSNRARKLRLWARDVAEKEMTATQANEYLEDTLADYERYMRLHSAKFEKGLIETLVVGSAELVEDIVKFRFANIAKRMLNVNGARTDLLIAELEAPGREVSMVSKLNANVAGNK